LEIPSAFLIGFSAGEAVSFPFGESKIMRRKVEPAFLSAPVVIPSGVEESLTAISVSVFLGLRRIASSLANAFSRSVEMI
jgi:hypothetical protein